MVTLLLTLLLHQIGGSWTSYQFLGMVQDETNSMELLPLTVRGHLTFLVL